MEADLVSATGSDPDRQGGQYTVGSLNTEPLTSEGFRKYHPFPPPQPGLSFFTESFLMYTYMYTQCRGTSLVFNARITVYVVYRMYINHCGKPHFVYLYLFPRYR